MTATSSPDVSARNLDDSAIALGGYSPLWDQGDQDELMDKATTAWERRNS